ncbi:hypothetical protein BO70DRAFT_288768 [Aspergillus heteromorphus CBS 117.55]|uniref:Uncharacterized protein n=1 Tax=Aspergillus heteromorphus CBS 117.55 TaxID=1448321 RepID=A0A317WPZ8_9EURO|nr:uncharacterized protein BO70DRAFT_288768 [Aspergillus heteromorphus CBS 117.55]PWY86310.1 hypothetical protein BO70DRAFT_288768 [Aspergillus heteromorphus CBS 117.55]
MLPPSESILHRLQKLATAARQSPQSQKNSTPPPPYSPTTPESLPRQEPASKAESKDTIQWETCRPVNIYMDASIAVFGNGNSVLISSMKGPAARSPNPTAPPPLTPASVPSSSTAVLESSQRQHQTKLTEMATSIISVLHRTGILNLTDNDDRSSSLTLNINTGIKVVGSGNVICIGAVDSVMRRKMNISNNNGGQEPVGMENRKRRAQSEPLEVPPTKRGRQSVYGK